MAYIITIKPPDPNKIGGVNPRAVLIHSRHRSGSVARGSRPLEHCSVPSAYGAALCTSRCVLSPCDNFVALYEVTLCVNIGKFWSHQNYYHPK